jgi:hypothetical protein
MTTEQLREFVELCKHPAIAGKRGEWVGTDHAWWEDTGKPETCYADAPTDQAILGQLAVWLPPVYDYQHPERGLWGMVNAVEKYLCEPDFEKRGLFTFKSKRFRFTIRERDGEEVKNFYGSSAPIALAKAIIWQHERTK